MIPLRLPIPGAMRVNDLVLVQGMADTRLALRRWNREPYKVVGPWLGLSLLITAALLLAVYAVARLTTPDATMMYLIPGFNESAGLPQYLAVLYRNSLVLALHALACVAGFIAGSSLPISAANRSGVSRWVHEKAGPLAIAFVACATAFSLCTQAYVIGGGAASVADQLGTTPGVLLLALAPHAVPELGGPLPAARRVDDRQPAGRLAGPARRHLRDGGRGDSGSAGQRRGRDMGLPPAPGRNRLVLN
jgi:hypothetical protein